MLATQVNLHNHTQGSFVDGLSSVEQSARRAKEVGSDAVSITDHNECNQHLAFQKACDAEGILPVFGIEADWVYDIGWTREHLSYPDNRSHICLLAENDEGLSNLWRLSSLAYTDEYRFYKPLINPGVMREHKAGLWASDGCLLTEFSRAIQKGDEELARHHFAMLHGIFGDRFYSELHTWQFINPGPDDHIKWNGEMILASEANQICRETNEAKIRFATEMGVPLVVVNDSHHAWPEQWFNKELVWRSTVGSSKRNKSDDKQQDSEKMLQKADHLMGGDELYSWMALHGVSREIVGQCIENSYRIAHSCTARIKPTLEMPRLNDSGLEDLRQLMAKCEQGFRDKVTRAGLDERVYFDRLQTELELIAAKQFPGYFLVVEDQVEAAVSGRWKPYIEAGAKLEPVLCGPGRGSAGGSLVAYLIGITSIDPIHYDLLFERFLTPGRKGNPDIDCDFPQSQRGGEKSYLSARYGHDHVCSIGTLTRSQPKALLKDLGKALGTDYIPWNDVIAMGKIIEHVSAIETEEGDELLSWADVVEKKGGELAPWAKKYPLLFEKLNEMGGIIRQSSVHASGVVVSNRPVIGALPTRSRPVDGVVVTQFDMNEVEELGAVKLDLLGIRHLDTLMHARKLVYDRHGVWLDYRRDDLPYELWDIGSEWADDITASIGPEARVVTFGYEHFADPAIWPQIDAGGTAGIFQLETPGLTRASMEVQPRNEEDVAALISIVRPGVKDANLDKEFIARRHGRSPIVYDHPMMEPLTKSTYGVLIYQEQLLRAARELAGFTPDEASDLQKALSKKKMDKVKALKEKFVRGCLANPEFTSVWDYRSLKQQVIDAGTQVVEKIWSSIEASGRYAFNKCTTGDTQVKLGAASQKIPSGTMAVAEMYERLHGSDPRYRSWRQKFKDPARGLRTWSVCDDGRLRPNRILDVHYNGTAPVWTVTLANGCAITTTDNHQHATPEGYVKVSDLRVGNFLLVDAGYDGVCVDTGGGFSKGKERTYHPVTGRWGYIDGGNARFKEWSATQARRCVECGDTEGRIERSHQDGDRSNNHPDNLKMLCVSCHKRHDYGLGRRKRGEKGLLTEAVEVVSIEYAGEQDVYDLEVGDPYHSWVGNGIVTHNSHAVGYSVISSWEIWTKHYYPQEYLVALMATDSENVNTYLREARQRGIAIEPPDINLSSAKFTIHGSSIRYGLDTIRGVGDAAMEQVLAAERPFTSIGDMLRRCPLGKAQMEALISIGALDGFRPDIEPYTERRRQLMMEYHDWRILMNVAEGKRAKFTEAEAVAHIAAWRELHSTDDRYREKYVKEFAVPDYADPSVMQEIEKDLVGNYITADPMARYDEAIRKVAITHPSQMENYRKGDQFIIGGLVTKLSSTKIKKEGRNKGREMGFLTLTWNDADFEATLFPDSWERFALLLPEGAPVTALVKRDDRGCNVEELIRLDMPVVGR